MSYLYSDLAEIKGVLQIDPNNHNEDFTLSLYNEWTSDIFTQILDRDIGYQVRTWYYQGTGTQKLNLKHRPVYPLTAPTKCSKLPFTAITVTTDSNGFFGFGPGAFTSDGSSIALTFGQDYTIKIDQDDGGSREAILYNITDYWTRPIVRQNGLLSPFVGTDLGSIQVIYTAGYTLDTLPASLRMAADMIVGRLRYIFPLGMQLTSESYIERSIGLSEDHKRFLITLARPYLWPWKNWYF